MAKKAPGMLIDMQIALIENRGLDRNAIVRRAANVMLKTGAYGESDHALRVLANHSRPFEVLAISCLNALKQELAA